jgi:hypothetical protein
MEGTWTTSDKCVQEIQEKQWDKVTVQEIQEK